MSFYLSKIIWLVVNPFNILVLCLFLTFFLLIIKKKREAFYLLSFSILIIIVCGFFPFGKLLIYSLEKKYHDDVFLPDKIDGIIILGGATNPFLTDQYDQISLNNSAERLVLSIQLIKKNQNSKIIFSGGSGSISNQELDHAKVAKRFFIEAGIDTNNIIFENKSRNTYENILLSKQLAKPRIDENWLVVTSAYHMNRAVYIGEKLNWKLLPYPVDFYLPKKFNIKPTLNLLGNFNYTQKGSHEWIGLISYYLMGRSEKIF